MNKLPSRLRRLDDALADLPLEDAGMPLSVLDGFLTGIAVCPDLVTPGEWLPQIWGGGAPPYDDPADMQWLTDMVLARYREIIRDLGRGKPQPLFDTDVRNGELLWDLWIDGFGTAMDMRPESWSRISASDDAEAIDALGAITTLVEIIFEESALTSIEINAICDDAADRIPDLVGSLHRWCLARTQTAPEPEKSTKPGRNDPCVCGSGQKFKRCCGAI